jgi:FkbM family methyltransferase
MSSWAEGTRSLVRVYVGRLRTDMRGLYWRLVKPSRIQLNGVRLRLEDWWATPTVREQIYMDRYEIGERAILTATLRPDDRFLEIGAGIGYITTLASQIVGADNVFAYEANPWLAQLARDTAQDNGFHPSVAAAVLGDQEGETDFYIHDDFWTSSLDETPSGRRVRVPVKSFRDELDRVKPTYMMIDIEGAEVGLLAGVQLPSTVRAICMETHPDVVGATATQNLLRRLMEDGFVLDILASTASVVFLGRDPPQG